MEPTVGSTPPWAGVTPAPGVKRGERGYRVWNTLLARLREYRDKRWVRTGYAAVLLSGWVLLAPSIDCARRGLQRETPLSEWEQVDHFSLEGNCEKYRATVIDAENADRNNLYVERYSYSICVPDDDPRLKPVKE